MIFIDIHEPDHVAADIIAAVKEPTRTLDLPWGDFWILPWDGVPELTLPNNLAEIFALLEGLGVTVDRFIQESGADLHGLAEEAALVFAHWLAQQSLVIESKTPTDFLNTWRAERLDAQALHMADHAKLCLFVVKGMMFPTADGHIQINGQVFGWNYWAVMDKITSLSLSGAPVIFVPDKRFPEYIAHLTAWFRRERNLVKPPKPHTMIPLSPSANFLCGLPGIGPKVATNILVRAHNDIGLALQILTDLDTLKSVDKPEDLGPKRIMAVREFLGLEPGEELMIKRPDRDASEEILTAPF